MKFGPINPTHIHSIFANVIVRYLNIPWEMYDKCIHSQIKACMRLFPQVLRVFGATNTRISRSIYVATYFHPG